MNMKLRTISMSIASLLILGSCTEQFDSSVVENPVHVGEEINFGTSLPSTVSTRTSYGEEVTEGGEHGNGYFPVYWEDGDVITILCPQAAQSKRVDYRITPMEGQEYTSTDVTKIDPDKAGLQWGAEDEHEFFGFYPASAIAEGDENPEDGIVTVDIPENQIPTEWYTDAEGVRVGKGNTDYTYMWAYAKVNKNTIKQGEPIPLDFEPMSTVLEITINGPTIGNMTVSSVTITSVDKEGTGTANTVLTGKVQCNIKAAATSENHQAVCTAVGDMGEVRNRIFISLYGANETGDGYPTLGSGDKLRVYAYLLPKDANIEKGTIQITVSPLNQARKVKTLQTDAILAHAINKVNLPALDAGGEGNNYWMSRLDPDIYLTELSWPGSKMSMATRKNDNNYFLQSTSLTEQFNLGVRAFDLQTMVNQWDNNNIYVATETQFGSSFSSIASLKSALAELAKCLEQAQQEVVFVNISYAAPRYEIFDLDFKNEPGWRNNLISHFEDWKNDKINIEEVTANTTLGDVAGTIVLRIHIKETKAYNNFSTSLPAQLVCYEEPYTGELVNMSWGTPDKTNGLQLLYQEASRLDNGGGIFDMTNFDGTPESKKEQVAAIVQKSIEQYNANDNHNIWYMMDVGGYYYSSNLGFLQQEYNSEQVAEKLTPYFFEFFNKREKNTSLGVVLMNFADNDKSYGVKYGCDDLIQTIIDNNFSFSLRKRGNVQQSFRSIKPVATSSDGWDE